MIEFTHMIVEGFCNIPHLDLQLNSKGITIIRGANGFGKSSIFSALVWVLYGKNLKGVSNVNTWEKVRDKDYKGTRVEIFFNKDGVVHQIIRCFNYKSDAGDGARGDNRLIYNIDACKVDVKNKSDIQLKINKSLDMSYNLFINTILFGQGMKRLIQESGSDQKAVFEEIFDLGYLSRAKTIAQEKYKDITQEILGDDREIINLSKNLGILRGQLSSIKDQEKSWDDQIKTKLNRLRQDKDLTTKRILELRPKLNQYPIDKLNEERESLRNSINRAENKLKDSQKELKGLSLEELINKIIRLLEKKEYSESLKVLRDIKKHYSIIEGSNNKLRVFYKVLNENSDKRRKYQDIENQINKEESKLDHIKEQLSSVKKDKPNFDKLKTNTKKSIREVKENISELKSKIEPKYKLGDIYKWAYTEPLSNNGIKAFLFESSLDNLNDILSSYSDIIGINIGIAVDLESSRKDFVVLINKNGQEVSFEELSGGEKQLASLAMAFAMNQLMNENKEVNITFLDEVFESLSQDNIEIVSNLIRKIYKDRTLFLITHHDSLPIPNARTLRVKNNNGLASYEF